MSLSLQQSPRSASAAPQIVVRAALKSPTHSHENRRLAKDLVWSWVGTKWPRLVPPRAELESAAASAPSRSPSPACAITPSPP